MNLKLRRKSLQKKITRYFVGFSILISVMFGGLNFISLYAMEDEFFNLQLVEEAKYLKAEFNKTGQWPEPRVNYMKLYPSLSSLPKEVYQRLVEEPEQVEITGLDNRYYHIYRFDKTLAPLLVAEVGSQLLVRSNRKGILYLLIFGMLVVTLAASIIGYRLAKSAITPLTHLADFVVNLSPDNLPTQLSSHYPNNEVGQLASALQQLMLRVKSLVNREQQFTRDTSHELRTPVAIIKSSIELILQNKQKLSDNELAHIKQISSACTQMEQTIETLLALAREQKQITNQEVKILPIVEQVVVQQAKHLNNKSVEVEVEVSPQDSVAMNDYDLLILLSNLIGNAFQYTNEGFVKISFEGKRLSVTDSGEGIEENIKQKATSDLVKGRRSKGFGIGLSLVSRLCEHHNIELELEHLNQGTCISLKFG